MSQAAHVLKSPLHPHLAAATKPERKRFRLHPLCILLILAFITKIAVFTPPQFSAGVLFMIYTCTGIGFLLIPATLAIAAFWICRRSSAAGNWVLAILVALSLTAHILLDTGLLSRQSLSAAVSSTTASPAHTPAAAPKPPKPDSIIRVYHR